MNEEFQTLNGRILVYHKPPETKTEGGLFIPESAAKATDYKNRGTVAKIPADCKLDLRIDDEIIFLPYSGIEVVLGQGKNKREYLAVNEADVIGVLVTH